MKSSDKRKRRVTTASIQKVLKSAGDPAIAEHSQRFFKTGPGEYGEGDRFLGIRVPVIRRYVREYRGLPLAAAARLLESPYHEVRLFALLSLVAAFTRGGAEEQTAIYDLYVRSTRYINNWDLIDASAPYIIGPYLENRSKKLLYEFARSDDLWERRIAIMSTFYFIRNDSFEDALKISRILLNDGEDLIHKAVGWMLREIGNRDPAVERRFLKRHYRRMPRTMLRYAIEKFPEAERKRYLKGTV